MKARIFIKNSAKVILWLVILCNVAYAIYEISQSTLKIQEKYSLYAQMAGVTLTIIALFFTYRAIRISQLQKNYSVRPIVVVSGIDLIGKGNITNSIDFHLVNEGIGIALAINVKVRRLADRKEVYNQGYMRLNVIESQLISIFNDIRNQLIKMNRTDRDAVITRGYSSNSIFVEVEFEDNEELYYSIMVEISFSDIYGKQYRNTFTFNYDSEEKEFNDGTESHIEI